MIAPRNAAGYIRKSPSPASSLKNLGRGNKGRYSRSTEKSVEEQKLGIEQLAAKHGYRVTRWFVDESVQGDADDRPAFLELMTLVRSQGCDIEAVLCWEQGRFSREDTLAAAVHYHTLRENDVALISVVEGVIVDPNADDDLSQDIVRDVVQFAKHKFLRDHAMAVARAKVQQMRQGILGGYTPYACRQRDDGRIEAGDAGQIRVLRWIFQAFADGIGKTAIARELNRRGVPSPGAGRSYRGAPSSGKWSLRTVLLLLTQRAYIADRRWGKSHTGRHVHIIDGELVPVPRKRRGQKVADPNGGRVSDVPAFVGKPLIVRNLWDAVQQRLSDDATTRSRRTDSSLPLVGLLRCGECGKPLNTHRMRRGAKQWEYYRCSGTAAWRQLTADEMPHREYLVQSNKLWTIVVNTVMDQVLSDERIAAFAEMVTEALKAQRDEGAETLPALEKQAAQLRAQLETLKRNMLYAPDRQAVAEFSTEVARVREQLGAITTSADAIQATASESAKGLSGVKANIRKYLKAMRAKLLSGDEKGSAEAIHSLLKRVTVHVRFVAPRVRCRGKPKSRAVTEITGVTIELRDSHAGLEEQNSWNQKFSISKLLAFAARISGTRTLQRRRRHSDTTP